MSTRWKRLFWLGVFVGSAVPYVAGLLAWTFVAMSGRVPINLLKGAGQLILAGIAFSLESVAVVALFALWAGILREGKMPPSSGSQIANSDRRWFAVCSGFVVMTLANVTLVFSILIGGTPHPMYSAVDVLNLMLLLAPYYFASRALAAMLIGSVVGYWMYRLLHKQ